MHDDLVLSIVANEQTYPYYYLTQKSMVVLKETINQETLIIHFYTNAIFVVGSKDFIIVKNNSK